MHVWACLFKGKYGAWVEERAYNSMRCKLTSCLKVYFLQIASILKHRKDIDAGIWAGKCEQKGKSEVQLLTIHKEWQNESGIVGLRPACLTEYLWNPEQTLFSVSFMKHHLGTGIRINRVTYMKAVYKRWGFTYRGLAERLSYVSCRPLRNVPWAHQPKFSA